MAISWKSRGARDKADPSTKRVAVEATGFTARPVRQSGIDVERIARERKRGLVLTLLVCFAAMLGDAQDVISEGSGFETSSQRWVLSIN